MKSEKVVSLVKLSESPPRVLTHLCRVDSSTLTLWPGPFPVKGVSGWFVLLPCFTEIPVLYANSVDPDQTPRSAASDLGLHCLPMSLLWDTRLKWVKTAEADARRRVQSQTPITQITA